ncbi:MAG TPA: TlyA family RNA methyltransferase [Acidimicrobiales bacterium]|nr:TlyA family RNA methyltransferase [Acidimicrobiales bacterium]
MTRSARLRLDRALVERGLVESRPRAAALIEQGLVLVSGSIADKPARLVASAEPVELLGSPPRFVSRGGAKLEAALHRFGIDPDGERALDAGASTGGFTDCLLQAGAASVVAVDVGRGQLHERLRADPRVVNCERTDIRDVTLGTVGGRPVDLVTADLSFISVTRAVPVLVGEVAVPGASVVILVKPQFEAGRVEASRGKGIIRDPTIHRRTLGEVASALRAAGAVIMGAMPSPITGSAGNIEFLIHAATASDPGPGTKDVAPERELSALLDAAVAEGESTGSRR